MKINALKGVNSGWNSTTTTPTASERNALATLLERAERIRTQKLSDKNKLYALHAPEVECIGMYR